MSSNDHFNKISSLAKSGTVSRREFINLAMVAGIATTTAGSFFPGVARAEPKRGGTFRMALASGSSSDSLDPATYVDDFSYTVLWGSLQNCLTEVDADGKVVPDLAESFEPSNKGATWTFKLRKGVTFHNGQPLLPEDVIETYKHHMGKDSKSPARPFLSGVDEITADGSDTVVFKLNAPNADFPAIASEYHLGILPSKQGGGVDATSGIGTGPFKLKNFKPGVSASLIRNENYHRAGPWFDAVEVLSVKDAASRTNALISGQVDYIDRCDPKTIELLKASPDVAVAEVTGYGHYALPMNAKFKPFDNKDVRLAMKYSLDREQMLKTVFSGYGEIGNDNPVAPALKYYTDTQPKFSYDPDKAKFHLKKAGVSDLKVDLSVADAAFVGAVDIGVLAQQHAKKCGIDINVIREPDDGYWESVWLKKPWTASFWNGRATIGMLLSLGYISTSPYNETGFNSPEFDQLVSSAQGELDETKRTDMYARAQQLLHEDSGQIVLMYNSYVSGYSSKLTNSGKIGANTANDGSRVTSRWWYA